MPALPTVTKTIKVQLGFLLNPGLSGSRFFINYTGGPPTAADLATYAEDVSGAWNSHLKTYQTTGWSLQNVVCTDLDSSTGARGEWTGDIAGTDDGGDPSAGICTVIDFVILNRYRGGKPRIYLPIGTPNWNENAQTWTDAFVTDVNTGWDNFISELEGIELSSFSANAQVNVPYYKGYNTSTPPWRGPGFKYPPKLQSSPVTPEVIQSVSTRQRIGSQRRRLSAAA